jgi:hypothetical protein
MDYTPEYIDIGRLESFDLELFDDYSSEKPMSQLTISCLALAQANSRTWFSYAEDYGRMDRKMLEQVVRKFMALAERGHIFVTWNGAAFDFQVLAYQSGMIDECAKLALYHHVDMMALVTLIKGYRLGLDAALAKLGIQKRHTVTLKNGETFNDMGGAFAPKMWREGETNAVLQYLEGDVREPLVLAEHIIQNKNVTWTSNSGRPMFCRTQFLTLAEAIKTLSREDVSWMSNPVTAAQLVEWMPAHLFEADPLLKMKCAK